MTYVTKFRANDLNPSKGKQIEFNKGVVDAFFKFTDDEATAEFECRSLADDAFKKTIKVSFKNSPARGDYKIYQNADGSSDLKDVFLQELHLTSAANGDDFYAIRDKGNGKYLLYYVPKSVLFTKFFPVINGDQILVADAGKSGVSASCEVSQLITYGAPGTGKSHKTKLETEAWKKNVFRMTFHPDSDYSTFVGAYKPTMNLEQRINCIDDKAKLVKDGNGNPSMQNVIAYDFVAQAFVKAYVLAWRKMAGAGDENGKPKPEPVFLVIEEINRGNCAQIFGDLFQLLDRDDAGYSEYPINADADLRKFLAKKGEERLGDIDANALSTRYGIEADLAKAIVAGEKLVLPPNFLIRATMNTSDQSLFPIDSAFKRRWDWEYVPISEPDVAKKRKIVCSWGEGEAHVEKRFDWWKFLDQFINKEILETTKSEDKQLGYFFVKAPDETGEITAAKFASKVLFYLYNDVFKDYNYPASVFERKSGTKEKFKFRDFFDAKGQVKDEVVAEFLENLGLVADAPEADRTSNEGNPAVHDEE